jgi:hypothetical protein
LATFYIKMIILPRQARDKHKNSAVFLQDLMERELARAELISKLRGAAAAAATAASAASGVPASNDNRRPHQQQQQQQQQTSMLRSWEEAVTGIMQDCAAAEEVESEMLLACADNTSFLLRAFFYEKRRRSFAKTGSGHKRHAESLNRRWRFQSAVEAAEDAAEVSSLSHVKAEALIRETVKGAKNGIFFLRFPYVCPEPVLVK